MTNIETIDPSILNQSLLLQRCLGDQALAHKLIGALVVRLPTELQSLVDAIHSSDWQVAARLAHRLKGTAANMAAAPLAEAAAKLESEARSSSDPTKCLELLEQLQFRVQQLLETCFHPRSTP